MSGLSCAITLEKQGVTPSVFENRSCIGDRYVNAESMFHVLNRPVKDCLPYLNKKYRITLNPITEVHKIVLHSKMNQEAELTRKISPMKSTTFTANLVGFTLNIYLIVHDSSVQSLNRKVISCSVLTIILSTVACYSSSTNSVRSESFFLSARKNPEMFSCFTLRSCRSSFTASNFTFLKQHTIGSIAHWYYVSTDIHLAGGVCACFL